jgi:hypothetical protein
MTEAAFIAEDAEHRIAAISDEERERIRRIGRIDSEERRGGVSQRAL